MNFDHVYLTTKGYEAFGSGIIGQQTVTWNECKTYNTDISNWEQTAINNATASSFDSVNQTSIGQVTSTSYVSTNDGNSVRIAITLRNTNNSGVLTYHGLARTLCVFGNVNGSSQLLIIAASDEPDTVPQNSEFKAFVDCYIVLSQDTISTINVSNSWYATANDLNTLKERVVTTHVEGNATQGESQTIYGEKTFISQMTTAVIKPRSNNTYSLGNDSYRWNTIYSQDGNFYNNVIVSNNLTVGHNITVAGTTSVAGDILPSDNAINLGDSSHRFAEMHITGGNNSDPQTCVVIDNSAARTTVRPLTNNTCYLGDSAHRWGTAYINTLYVNGPDGDLNITDTKVTVRDETSSGSPTSKTLAKYVTDKIQTTSSSASSSADKWTNTINFTIKDNSLTNTGIPAQVDGSADVDLILPPTIDANVTSANTAGSLSSTVTIDGVNFDGSANITHYGTCNTPSATTEKAVTLNSGAKITSLTAGTIVAVKFTNGNTADKPTLKVGNTAAKNIYVNGYRAGTTTSLSWGNNYVIEFIYDGSYWHVINHSTNVEYANNLSSYLGNGVTVKLTATNTQITAKDDIVPDSNNSYDLGSTSYTWKNLYAGGANEHYILVGYDDSLSTNSKMSIRPDSTGLGYLGTSNKHFNAAYIDNIYVGNDSIKSNFASSLSKNGSVSSSANSNTALVLKSKSGAVLSTVYISDIIANALRGRGGYGTETSTSSYGSIGSIGLFVVHDETYGASETTVQPGNTISASRLHFLDFGALGTGFGYPNISSYFVSTGVGTISGTWSVLNYAHYGEAGSNRYHTSIVLAVRVY